MLLLIDNYDSFTYNLVHYFGELGAEICVKRNDEMSLKEALDFDPSAIVLSPGPGAPDKAGICTELVLAAEKHRIPLLGVCLGHQAIGAAFGGHIVRAPDIVHGKMGRIEHRGHGILKDLPSPLTATRYHSLMIDPDTLPSQLEITGELRDGTIMAVRHRRRPIYGVQFHPESIASDHGHDLLQNFLDIARSK